MDFRSYLNNLLSDSEIGKWSALYVPLHITESAEDLPVIPCLRQMILEETKGLIEDGTFLPEGLAWTKKRQTIQELIEGLQEEPNLSSLSSGIKDPLILIGESGSGKTTSLRYLTGSYAAKCLEDIAKSGQDVFPTPIGADAIPVPTTSIPVFLDMGGFRCGNFSDYILDELNNRKLPITHDQLLALFEQNLFLVLIDGLDLLCPYEGFNPVESIQKFISQFPKNHYILSCRKGVCYTSFPANYKVIELLELTEDDIREYLGHYIKDTEKRDVVFNAIMEDPSLKDIAESPLLLLLMMATFIRYKKIPKNKTDVYSAYIKCLYDLFEKMGKLVEADKEIIAQGLSMIGFTLQMYNATVLDKQEVITLFKNIANRSGYKGNPPEEMLHLCTQLGIVRIQKNEVKFFYQSFREYFAAEMLKQLFLQGIDLSIIYNHPRWEDVLVYLSGLMDMANTSNLVKTILNMPYKYRDPIFLAAECVASGDVDEAIEDNVVGLLRERLNDRYWHNQREALYGLARIAGRAVRKQASLSDKMAKDYLDEAGKDKAVDIFIQRLRDEDWIRREKSARALGKICDREVIPYLERLLADESPSVYNAAFEAIIEIERRERENVIISFPQVQEDILPRVIPIKKKEIEIVPKSEIHDLKPKPPLPEGLSPQEIMPAPLPVGKTTIVFMSLLRSMELIRQIGETRGLTGLQVYNNIVKIAVNDCQGKVLKFTGGTYVSLFEEPESAINASVKVQEAIDEYNLRQPSRKLYMRIGMASGNPQPQVSITSIEVNLAVRIGRIAIAGQILAGENTHKIIKSSQTTIKFRYFGSKRLLIDETKVGIYELLWRGESYASMIKESVMAVEYLEIAVGHNVTKNIQISARIKIARSFLKRAKGLMFEKSPDPLLMEYPHPTGTRVSVHMLFVSTPLDIIWLDSSFKVVDIAENVVPFSLSKPATWKAYTSQRLAKYVLELPAGRAHTGKVEVGDLILFKEQKGV
ncbi:MAG: DUF192 domain-containing protein [bacterium]